MPDLALPTFATLLRERITIEAKIAMIIGCSMTAGQALTLGRQIGNRTVESMVLHELGTWPNTGLA